MTEKREITCFFCREFIALYLEKELDATRTQQINSHIKECYECEELFQKVSVAHQVLKEIAQVQPNTELISFLQKEHNFWTEFFDRFGWKKWPEGMRWATELVAIAVLLGLTVNIFPWVDVVRIVKNIQTATIQKKAPPASTPEATEIPPTLVADGKPVPSPTPTPAAVIAAVPSPSPVAVAVAPAPPAPAPSAPPAKTEKQTGYVWRGVLRIDPFDQPTVDKLTKAIIDLGGSKAGKVDLGWSRGANDRYYHFVLPEANHEKLMEIFKAEGALRISKEPHPRLMKAGVGRYIVNVEALNRSTERPADTQEEPAENAPAENADDAKEGTIE